MVRTGNFTPILAQKFHFEHDFSPPQHDRARMRLTTCRTAGGLPAGNGGKEHCQKNTEREVRDLPRRRGGVRLRASRPRSGRSLISFY
jgi:hypothetical protein